MNMKKYLHRQTSRDYDKIRVTIAVEDPNDRPKASRPHYRRAPKQRAQDHDKELIKEIVREVVSEVMAQMGTQQSCETCPNRSNQTPKNKRLEQPADYHYDSKPSGIEYR